MNKKRIFLLLLILVQMLTQSFGQKLIPLKDGFRRNGDLSCGTYDSISNNLYVGGVFEMVNGQKANNIAKWNGNSWSSVGLGTNELVQKLKIFQNKLFAFGFFTKAGNSNCHYYSVWDGLNWEANDSIDGSVTDLDEFSNELYICGSFTNVNGVRANNLAKWNGIKWDSVSSYPMTTVNEIVANRNRIIIGGYYSTPNLNIILCIKTITNSTTTLQKFVFKQSSFTGCSNFTLFNDTLFFIFNNNICHLNGNKIITDYTFLNSKPLKFAIDSVNFYPIEDSSSLANEYFKYSKINRNTLIKSLIGYSKVDTNTGDQIGDFFNYQNQLLSIGWFKNFNEKTSLNIMTINPTNNSFNNFGKFISKYPNFYKSYYSCTSLVPSFAPNECWVGGSFSFAGDSNAMNIAKWDGTDWKPIGSGFNGVVSNLIEYKGVVYAGGNFVSTANGDTSVHTFARWSGNKWEAVPGAYITGVIYTMEIYKGDLILGGALGQSTLNLGNLIKFNGISISSVGGFPLSIVSSIAVLKNDLYIGLENQSSTFNSSLVKYNGAFWIGVGNFNNGVQKISLINNSLIVSKQKDSLIAIDTNGKQSILPYLCSYKNGYFDGMKAFNMINKIFYAESNFMYLKKNIFQNIFSGYVQTASQIDSKNYIITGTFGGYDSDPTYQYHWLNCVAMLNFSKPDSITISSNKDTICHHQYVNYAAHYDNVFMNYKWIFPGGTPSTSSQKFPVIQYQKPGHYKAKLYYSNFVGNDSILLSYNVIVDTSCNNQIPSNATFINTLNDKILIYPNPFQNTFTIRFESEMDKKISVQIFQIDGKKIELENISSENNKLEINLSNQQSGIYILEINDGLQLYHQKIIKN